MCKNATHAPGCMRLSCWTHGVERGRCPKGCERTDRDGNPYYPSTDCTMGPGVCCDICGTYWVPEDIPAATLAEMRDDYEREMPPFTTKNPADVDRVFGKKRRRAA